ncbi:MAG TPA: hypothetical protein VIM29_01965 [Bacillota bacterium]
MPEIVYSTGPIEQEPGVDELRLKALNNSTTTADVFITVYDLNGTKQVFYNTSTTLSPLSSEIFFVDIPNVNQFEVEFSVSNPEVLVAVFGVNPASGAFSAANSVRHGEMVNISAGQ